MVVMTLLMKLMKMSNIRTIEWKYATNFTENEKRFEEVKILLIEKIRIITKNPILSMTMMEDCIEAREMIHALEDGDRSEFLYKKAKEAVDSAICLEEAGNIFYTAISRVIAKQLDK